MKTRACLILLCAVLFMACSYRPAPVTVERNYEGGSITKMVKVGGDDYQVLFIRETLESAKQRLLSEIARECPAYTILAEGTQNKDREVVSSHYNVVREAYETSSDTVTDTYLWIRYRCEKGGSSSSRSAPAKDTSGAIEEMQAAAFRSMATKCGEAYARGMNATQELQTARLQTGDFSLQEQGDIALKLLTDAPLDERTRLFLDALRIAPEGERSARADYWRFMNLSAAEFRQRDAFDRYNIGLFYTTYLKEVGIRAEPGLVCNPSKEQ